MITDPTAVARFAFQPRKIIYVIKLTGPLCFFPFLSLSGAVLMGYGFAMSLLASRQPLFTIGFQYALQVVPYAFVAALLALVRLWPASSTRRLGMTRGFALFGWALASAAFCVAFGMIGPRTHFQGGFRRVVFSICRGGEEYRVGARTWRRAFPRRLVTASETLVPHVSQRRLLQTLKYGSRARVAIRHVFPIEIRASALDGALP